MRLFMDIQLLSSDGIDATGLDSELARWNAAVKNDWICSEELNNTAKPLETAPTPSTHNDYNATSKTPMTFSCLCGNHFSNKDLLVRHIDKFNHQIPCSSCQKLPKSPVLLKDHFAKTGRRNSEIIFPYATFECGCGKPFKTFLALQDHQNHTQHPMKPFNKDEISGHDESTIATQHSDELDIVVNEAVIDDSFDQWTTLHPAVEQDTTSDGYVACASNGSDVMDLHFLRIQLLRDLVKENGGLAALSHPLYTPCMTEDGESECEDEVWDMTDGESDHDDEEGGVAVGGEEEDEGRWAEVINDAGGTQRSAFA